MSLPDGFSPAWIGAILFFIAMLAALPGMLSVLRRSEVEERINERLTQAQPTERGRRAKGPSGVSDIVASLAKSAERFVPTNEAQLSVIRDKLIRAGFTNRNAVALFFGSRVALIILPQIGLLYALGWLGTLNLPQYFPTVLSLFLAAGGFYLPQIYVDRRIDSRVRQCSEGFPDMMDLLVACVEAGLSLDAAVGRVSEEMEIRHKELALNLKTLALEMRAGRSRKAAWRAFADRVGLEEAGSLATMLRQSEEMGTSLGETLRIFSSDMRQRRILIAEEKAMALPAKMTVPLIVFVFPVLLGVLVLPAIIRFQSLGLGEA